MLLKITIVVLLISNVLLWLQIIMLRMVCHYLIRDINRYTMDIKDFKEYLQKFIENIKNFTGGGKNEG